MAESERNQGGIPEALVDESIRKKLTIARQRTRGRLARKLEVTRQTVQRWEKRSDLYLATMREVAERRGAGLRLEVSFADEPPVILSCLGEQRPKKQAKNKPASGSKSKPKTGRVS
jgi:hypothetical protein